MSFTPLANLSRNYFRSGWAPLVSYLIAYLLYARFKWPVNAWGAGSREQGAGILGGGIPLLYFYWALHAMHLVLAAVALRGWWKDGRDGTWSMEYGAGTEARSRLAEAAIATLPWLGLALLFWIPGLYLEWPSDPWEHFRRINEWHAHGLVTDHSAWKKSSYFLPYSLSAGLAGSAQLRVVQLYFVAISLTLCWQYQRLARAVGLGPRAAMLFVLVQVLVCGNSVFSFYRYYGISSSIVAQVAAVAIMRIAIEYLLSGAAARRPASLATAIAAVSALLLLAAYNHIQSVGIALLGLAAIAVWRLAAWKPRALVAVIAVVLVLSGVARHLLPSHPTLEKMAYPQGWLNSWGSFAIWSPTSPAFERAWAILGLLGLLNVVSGVWLVGRRNHVVGWLTIVPVLALVLPCTALPLALVLVTDSEPGNLINFNRMLFAIPAGLALVTLLTNREAKPQPFPDPQAAPPATVRSPAHGWTLGLTLPALLLAGMVLPFGSGSFNRTWHVLAVTPADLELRALVRDWDQTTLAAAGNADTLTLASPLARDALSAFRPRPLPARFREFHNANLGPLLATTRRQWEEAIAYFRGSAPAPAPESEIIWRAARATITSLDVPAIAPSDRAWTSLGGKPPEIASVDGRTVAANPASLVSHAFEADLHAVSSHERYEASLDIRQTAGPAASNYLAVAWYGTNGLLESNQPAPQGAGDTAGWTNGTYSYFGLVGAPAAPTWTTYRTTFGFGTSAAIPSSATSLRLGAVLNRDAIPGAHVEISRVRLAVRPFVALQLILPDARAFYTPESQAAKLSGHWMPRRLQIDSAGSAELRQLLPASARSN